MNLTIDLQQTIYYRQAYTAKNRGRFPTFRGVPYVQPLGYD